MIYKRFLFAVASLVISMGFMSFSPGTDDVEPMCFNLENSVAGAFLEDAAANYRAGIGREGISRLRIHPEEYFGKMIESDYPQWTEQPAGVRLCTKGGSSVVVSKSPTFAKQLSFAAEGDSTMIYNLVPQTVYWYKVLDASGKEVSDGIFKTLGRLRMIKSDIVSNVRDLGGWLCRDDDGNVIGQLDYGKLIRSATLSSKDRSIVVLDQDDKDVFLNTLGVNAEIDLTSTSKGSSPLGSSVKYNSFALNAYMYQMTNTYYNKSKKQVYSGSYHYIMAKCINQINTNLKNGRCSDIHCTWGADRTGTLIMLLEAICGVSEVDLVTDWELTSLMSVMYFKIISEEESPYYYKSGSKIVADTAEMRSVFEYLHDNYGGKDGASIRQQATAWLQQKVFGSYSDKGAAIIQSIRDQLIVPVVKSPTIVKDMSTKTESLYVTAYEETTMHASNANMFIEYETGKTIANDAVSSTDYIDCSGYNKLLVNVAGSDIAAFYDKDKNYIGGIQDSAIAENYPEGTVIFDNREYDIPEDAVYVRLNMAKHSGWTAVMSEGTIF